MFKVKPAEPAQVKGPDMSAVKWSNPMSQFFNSLVGTVFIRSVTAPTWHDHALSLNVLVVLEFYEVCSNILKES